MPSPRFSTAGNHVGSSAMSALSTSDSYSPSTFGITGSSRVNPASASTSRSRCTWMTDAMPSLPVDRRQTDSGRRRAWKSGSTGTSSPKPSGTASSASSSAYLIGRSAPAPPERRAAIASNTSSSENVAKRPATPGYCFTKLSCVRSLTICSCCQSSSTASSTSVPRSGRDRTLSTCGNQAFDAVRISSRLGRSQGSFAWRPSQGLAPLQVPSGNLAMSVASCMRRDLPHSQRTICSARSPLVPRSSSLSCRRQWSSGPCTNRCQSMSSTCPREQARTNRVATTGLLSNLPRSSAVRRTMRREREPACPGEPGLDSCTTNHSGNRHAPIPRCRSCQCSGSDGGVYSRGSCTPVMEVSLAAKRGSSIGSRLVSAPQVSSPPTMADSFGRSIKAPGPNVVMTWLRRNCPCALPFIRSARPGDCTEIHRRARCAPIYPCATPFRSACKKPLKLGLLRAIVSASRARAICSETRAVYTCGSSNCFR